MNAHERKKDAKEKELIRLGAVAKREVDAAQAEVTAAKTRCASFEALLTEAREHISVLDRLSEEHRTVRVQAEQKYVLCRDEVMGLKDKLTASEAREAAQAAVVEGLQGDLRVAKKRIAYMETEDKDAAKLRRRLVERGSELEAVRERILNLEGELHKRKQAEAMTTHMKTVFQPEAEAK